MFFNKKTVEGKLLAQESKLIHLLKTIFKLAPGCIFYGHGIKYEKDHLVHSIHSSASEQFDTVEKFFREHDYVVTRKDGQLLIEIPYHLLESLVTLLKSDDVFKPAALGLSS
jgi:hypothetical protein